MILRFDRGYLIVAKKEVEKMRVIVIS